MLRAWNISANGERHPDRCRRKRLEGLTDRVLAQRYTYSNKLLAGGNCTAFDRSKALAKYAVIHTAYTPVYPSVG